ncbi:biogenesis of lysosome-related organelles complex 1 subunit 2 isoform X1 [Vidua macroura]|uniref:biogenesis of lysosome-related organelles complex 1 subunit 2 isoform X1 n=1 Tax=Vidua macroura TaxID=187451 RepID=UPI0023A7A3E8|nr:biogenesis of lysosome-related organelles complex 1 subunit 2 isoform X1 [Vidua macroura]
MALTAQPHRAQTRRSGFCFTAFNGWSKVTSYHVLHLEDPAVETAEEAKEPAEADINELCKDMFSKMATYLTGELTATSEDYKLLENMNKLTSLKYLEMKDIAINISRNLKDLNQKYADLQPYLEQINLIEEQVAALEQAAYKLDAYSKKLEAKYKKLEKR